MCMNKISNCLKNIEKYIKLNKDMKEIYRTDSNLHIFNEDNSFVMYVIYLHFPAPDLLCLSPSHHQANSPSSPHLV